MTPYEKFAATQRELAASMIERDQEIALVLTALIAQEHVLLIGPPGTAKSMLADAITSWMDGHKFSVLFNRFTTPEEVFGPISVAGLKADVYRRIVAGKLPSADLAFVDEVFNGSSAILNTMLQILNERTFQNDGTLIRCPLKLCVAASNAWPCDQEGGKELGALFDRFAFRKSVRPIATEKGIDRLLWHPKPIKLSTKLTALELAQASAEASSLDFTDEAKEALLAIYRAAKAEGICPGDRRLQKSIKAAQASAWLAGATEVEPDHMEILSHVLWDDPTEQPKKLAEIVGRVANPTGMKINGLLMEAEEIIAKADLKELSQAAVATKKLGEVAKQLKAVTGERARQAHEHVAAEIKRIKVATVNAMS